MIDLSSSHVCDTSQAVAIILHDLMVKTNTSVGQLAKKSGVKKKRIRRYLESKQDIPLDELGGLTACLGYVPHLEMIPEPLIGMELMRRQIEQAKSILDNCKALKDAVPAGQPSDATKIDQPSE